MNERRYANAFVFTLLTAATAGCAVLTGVDDLVRVGAPEAPPTTDSAVADDGAAGAPVDLDPRDAHVQEDAIAPVSAPAPCADAAPGQLCDAATDVDAAPASVAATV